MKMLPRIKLGGLWVSSATLLLLASARADTTAFSLGSVSETGPRGFEGTRGWQFFFLSLGNPNPIAITQLGVFDAGGDGLLSPHRIGFWQVDGGGSFGALTLLASATVPAGTDARLEAGYRFVPITPMTINPNSGYFVVAADFAAADADDQMTPFPAQFAANVVSWPQGRYGLGSDFPYPSTLTSAPCEGCAAERFWEPNFQFTFVPEPSVWFLLAPGMLWLWVRQRGRVGPTPRPRQDTENERDAGAR